MWAVFLAAASLNAANVPRPCAQCVLSVPLPKVPAAPGLYEQCVPVAAQQPTSPITTPTPSAEPVTETPDRVRTFAEGVRINWPELTVEVDAEVVLREGPLELFACSPQTKEHESILKVPARPLHIFQAMGLIGLNPGKPWSFNEETKQWVEPRGDRIELRVRYVDGRGTHEVAPEQWVSEMKGQNAAQPIVLDWIFTGSTNQPDGRFSADADGAIACLVDFESALIALRTRHSAENEQLWLTANTKEIPPRGTKCSLLIRSQHRPTIEVELVDEHTARYKDKSFTPEGLAKAILPPQDDNRSARLIIYPTTSVSDDAVAAFVEKITKSGFQGAIETKRRQSKIPPPG